MKWQGGLMGDHMIIESQVAYNTSEYNAISGPLTKGELDVAKLWNAGKTVPQIASSLGMGSKAVWPKLFGFIEKTGCNNVADIYNWFCHHVIVEIDDHVAVYDISNIECKFENQGKSVGNILLNIKLRASEISGDNHG